ncbi:MAG: uroporphyrinogen-III C-methyltransferase, partial [Limnobacter sp.]|nr:uroporphyrinogen-III C-methyltransferase [Limnobacter sp.]
MSQSVPTLVITKPKLVGDFASNPIDRFRKLKDRKDLNVLFLPVFRLSVRKEANDSVAEFASRSRDEGTHPLIVFVSPSALEFGMSVLKVWPKGVACGLMGPQSAELAKELGVPEASILAPGFSDTTVTEDSDGLHTLILRNYKAANCEVLVCKGPLGRSSFYEKLIADKFRVEVLETYHRDPIKYSKEELKALLDLQGQAVLWMTSSESVKVLCKQLETLPEQWNTFKQSAQALVTHPRILTETQEMGFSRVKQISTGLQSVLDWWQSTFPPVPESSNNTEALQPKQRETAPSMNASQEQVAQPKPAKLPLLLSILALIGLLGLAFIGQHQLEKTRQVVGERLQGEKTRVKVLEEKLDKTEGLYRDLKARFELLETAQKESASQQEALEAVYQELVASRSAVSISEIDQLVSIAKRQLFVLGNPDGAKVALRQALELLDGTEEPNLLSLKNSIEKDLAELNAIKEVNLLALALELDSIIDSVDTMPTLAAADATKDMTLAELSHGGPGMERVDPVQHDPNVFQATWGAVSGFVIAIWEDVKGLVEITKVDKPEVLLLSARQQTDLRNTLRLSILNARLSLLSRHGQLLKSDINRSRAITSIYFDQRNPQVQRALKVLDK